MKVTDIFQSKRLMAAGIDPRTSDMCYAHPVSCVEDAENITLLYYEPWCDLDVAPAWSLGALWEEVSKYCKFAFDENDKPEDIIESLVSLYEQYKESRK